MKTDKNNLELLQMNSFPNADEFVIINKSETLMYF